MAARSPLAALGPDLLDLQYQQTSPLRDPLGTCCTPVISTVTLRGLTIGSTSLGRIRMIVNVVISSDTRTVGFNCRQRGHHHGLTFATGRVGLYETTYLGPEDALTMTVVSSDLPVPTYISRRPIALESLR